VRSDLTTGRYVDSLGLCGTFNINNAVAELRNRIYTYCHEDGQVRIDRASEGVQQTIGFRGLTQASRQLRQEFRPLYLEQTSFALRWPHLIDKYLSAFYPETELDIMANYRGEVIIPVVESAIEPKVLSVDIAPVFCMVVHSPGLHLRFKLKLNDSLPSRLCRHIAQLNDMLNTLESGRDPTWSRLVQEPNFELELHVYGNSHRVYSGLKFLLHTKENFERFKGKIHELWAKTAELCPAITRLEVAYGYSYDEWLADYYGKDPDEIWEKGNTKGESYEWWCQNPDVACYSDSPISSAPACMRVYKAWASSVP
jgi:hypothetical protein